MTTMTATAVITAVDRASGVFARVGQAAKAQAAVVTSAATAMQRFMNTGGGILGATPLLFGAISTQGEYEVDKLTRLMHSAGELTERQRERLKAASFDASLLSGLKAQELIEAQREAIQGGLDPDSTIAMTEIFAKVARSNGIVASKVAEDAINVSNALGFAMGTTEEKVTSLKRAMEFMSVVPNLSTESWEGLRTSLKYAAPVAGALKIPIEELGAALSILADAGFKGEEGGTALRTVLTRAIAPTRQARLEMRAAGIDLERLYKFDQAALGNMRALAERLRGAGLGQGINLDVILGKFSDPKQFSGLYDFQDKISESLMAALGIKKGDAEARGILTKVVQGHVRAAAQGFDIEQYFTGIAKLGLPAMKEMFGLQRISQAEKLRDAINKIMQLPTGERINRFRDLANQFNTLMPNSIDRRFGPVSEGFAFNIDRAVAALARLRNAIFESGVGSGLANALAAAAGAIERFAKVNPQALRDISIAIGGLLALGPAAWVLRSIGGGLAMISGALAGASFAKIIAGGGLAAMLLGDIGKMFEVVSYDPFGAAITPYDRLRDSLGGVLSEAGQLAALLGSIANDIKGMFGGDQSESLLLSGLRGVNFVLTDIATNIRNVREGLDGMWNNPTSGALDKFARGYLAFVPGGRLALNAYDAHMNKPEITTVRDLGGKIDRVEVAGQAEVNVKSEVTVRVEGPGVVTDTKNGQTAATVPLNPGKSMPDTAAPYPMP